ncbi:(Fe-S)-binding protein [Helicobacter cynogastricus]|uniref:(Fe-S)-binding protein n=1 Tax=Helicobacter cynogastricus TaxID=329937 RepID=UPI000CF1B76A|nr:(Fe-S)-binding protein [Helicobacter cynogastricus]
MRIWKNTVEIKNLVKPFRLEAWLDEDITRTTQACVKCAKCVPSCTIYRIHKDETTSPRGFLDLIALVKQESLELDTSLKRIFESCFLCTTCVQVCPFHLPIDRMIEKARVLSAHQHGITWHKKLYFALLKRPRLMDLVFSFCAVSAPCIFKRVGDKMQWRFQALAPKILAKRALFPFVRTSFLRTHQGVISPKAPLEGMCAHSVGIFIGCLGNYNYPNIGKSLLSILDKLNISAHIPKQFCCGAPAFFTGDMDTALFLAKKNVSLLEGVPTEKILVPEATCISMLKKDYCHVFESMDDPIERTEWLKRWEKVADKLEFASTYLHDQTPLLKILQNYPQHSTTLTYHDPCHAKKVLGVYKEPRALLQTNFSLTEMAESDRCCGFGGVSMQSDHYPLSVQAGLPKAQDIAHTRAQVVSAECSACRVQLNNALHQIDAPTQFLHPLELIAQVLQTPKTC